MPRSPSDTSGRFPKPEPVPLPPRLQSKLVELLRPYIQVKDLARLDPDPSAADRLPPALRGVSHALGVGSFVKRANIDTPYPTAAVGQQLRRLQKSTAAVHAAVVGLSGIAAERVLLAADHSPTELAGFFRGLVNEAALVGGAAKRALDELETYLKTHPVPRHRMKQHVPRIVLALLASVWETETGTPPGFSNRPADNGGPFARFSLPCLRALGLRSNVPELVNELVKASRVSGKKLP